MLVQDKTGMLSARFNKDSEFLGCRNRGDDRDQALPVRN